ncbi:MAG: 50S ribosomal protein L35 [Azoarcus sp.]|jgi:large subunit ribosomal protein L35|nr:50S ribosomal protein L35 [Azoarcus sp.]
MPKMKTKSGAKKRFKVRASGGIKRSHAFKRHILTKKTTKSKRQLRGTTEIHPADEKLIRAMLPFA